MADIEKQGFQSMTDDFYRGVAGILEKARDNAYRAVNSAMV